MSDETQPEPITYLLRHSGCISGPTECCFEVAIQKALNMPLGTEVVELYEWPEELITRLSADLAAVTEERDRMKEAIKLISGQPLSSELDAEAQDNADYKGAYDSCIKAARAASEVVMDKKGAEKE